MYTSAPFGTIVQQKINIPERKISSTLIKADYVKIFDDQMTKLNIECFYIGVNKHTQPVKLFVVQFYTCIRILLRVCASFNNITTLQSVPNPHL